MKTLVVEDDLKSQCLLAKVLAERGHEVTTFENAEQAILAYQREFYPLLFVDAGLPGMDGLQFCRWIRSQPNGEKVFVMVATEPNMPTDVSKVLELGANDFLSKPYELNSLRARLSIAEQQMESFFEQQELEKALEDETRRWTQVEADIAEIRRGFECQIEELRSELAELQEQLELEQTARHRLETELETKTALASRTEAELDQARKELEARCREAERAVEEATRDAEQAQEARRQAEAILAESRQATESRGGADAEELARTIEALEHERKQSSRLATELEAEREGNGSRIRELTESLAESDSKLAEVGIRGAQLEAELTDARERLASQLRTQTSELLDLSDQLKAHIEARRYLDDELTRTRDEMTRRAREQTTELLRLSDELKVAVMERQRIEEEFDGARHQHAAELKQREAELREMREQFQRESEQHREALEEGRRFLTDELEQARRDVTAFQAEIGRNGQELAEKSRTLEKLEENLRTHREARKRVESRWQAVKRLGTELNRAETPEEAARAVAILARDLVGWEVFSLDAYSEEGDWIHPVLNLEYVNGRQTDAAPFHPGPQPTSLMRRVLEDGPQLVLRPAPSCSQTDLVVFGDRARRSASLLYAPVMAGERVIGFLSVRSAALDAYDGDDIETILTLGTFCGGALERLEARGRVPIKTSCQLEPVIPGSPELEPQQG